MAIFEPVILRIVLYQYVFFYMIVMCMRATRAFVYLLIV